MKLEMNIQGVAFGKARYLVEKYEKQKPQNKKMGQKRIDKSKKKSALLH